MGLFSFPWPRLSIILWLSYILAKIELISSNEITVKPPKYFVLNNHTNTTIVRSLWTAYLPETELIKSKSTSSDTSEKAQCNRQFPNAEKPRSIISINKTINDEVNKYKLWSGVMSSYDLEQGKVLYGMYEGLEAIWKNQHPEDCSKVKFLLAENFEEGFGSELHIQGQKLAIALSLGRVLIQGKHIYIYCCY